MDKSLKDRINKVRCIALDVDGVLTDGKLLYFPDGMIMPSAFNVQDGLGVRVAIESGVKVVFISGNWTDSVKKRAEHLRVSAHYLGVGDKIQALSQASKDLQVPFDEFAYVGDDLNDLGPFKMAGFAVAVRQAAEELKELAHYVTEREGGSGAVREVIELILREQGLWETAVRRFLSEVEKVGFCPPGQ